MQTSKAVASCLLIQDIGILKKKSVHVLNENYIRNLFEACFSFIKNKKSYLIRIAMKFIIRFYKICNLHLMVWSVKYIPFFLWKRTLKELNSGFPWIHFVCVCAHTCARERLTCCPLLVNQTRGWSWLAHVSSARWRACFSICLAASRISFFPWKFLDGPLFVCR